MLTWTTVDDLLEDWTEDNLVELWIEFDNQRRAWRLLSVLWSLRSGWESLILFGNGTKMEYCNWLKHEIFSRVETIFIFFSTLLETLTENRRGQYLILVLDGNFNPIWLDCFYYQSVLENYSTLLVFPIRLARQDWSLTEDQTIRKVCCNNILLNILGVVTV